jgi:hypothetical protein
MARWEAALPHVAKATVYPNEGHTVQYRHWDQTLATYSSGSLRPARRDWEPSGWPTFDAGALSPS